MGGGGHWTVEIVSEVERAVHWLMGKKGLGKDRSWDIACEAFAACAGKTKRPARPKAYYWQAVRNAYDQYLRDEKGRTESLLGDPPAREPSPLQQAWRNQLREKRDAILDAMPPQQAAVAWLYLEGLSLAEAARELGLATSTARSHWTKAAKALEEGLGDWLDR